MASHLQIDKEPQAVELQPILELNEPSSSRAEVLLGKLRRWSQSSVVRTAVRNLALIALWYVLGTSLTLWNKWLVDKKKAGFFGKGPFPAPFLLSSLQFFAQHLTARALMATGISRRQGQGSDWKHYIKTVVPNGVATGLDIGFSNYSLVFITISFYVMCKSTTPLFLLIFAIAWGVEKASWSLAGVVVVIASGLLLLVAGETKFDLVGFLLVMTAAMLAGLRWTITQVLLHGHKAHGAGTPTEVIYQLTPVMGITVLLLSLFHDRLWNTLPGSPYFADLLSVFLTLLIVLAGGLIAFAMVWSEFMLIKCTSALTFMVAGTFKEIITVMAGVVLDGDRFTAINAVGLGVLILGVVLFNIQKYHKLRQGEMKPVHLEINGHDQHQGHKLTTPNEVPLEANGRGSSLAGSPAALSQLQERRGMVLLHEDEELMLSSGHMADVGEDVALLLPGAGSGFCVWEASQQQQHHQQQQEEQRVRSLAGSPRSPGGTQSLQRRDSV